jgi:hypothetical protein
MHEFFRMPIGWSAAYVADWALFAAYAAYVLGACLLSGPFRSRVHRGTWLHVVEGWALVAVIWAAWAWAHFALAAGDRDWSGSGPVPGSVRAAAFILYALQPAVLLLPVIMIVTTAVRAWRFEPVLGR